MGHATANTHKRSKGRGTGNIVARQTQPQRSRVKQKQVPQRDKTTSAHSSLALKPLSFERWIIDKIIGSQGGQWFSKHARRIKATSSINWHHSRREVVRVCEMIREHGMPHHVVYPRHTVLGCARFQMFRVYVPTSDACEQV